MKTLYRTYWLVLLLALLPSLAACPAPRMVHEKAPDTAIAKAQAVIDEANLAIAATASTVLQNWKDGLLTDKEMQTIREGLNDAASYRDKAQMALDVGDLTESAAKVKLANNLLELAKKQLAAKRRKT